ncbi:MAG: hypothetical protein HY329_03220, partial [Chloroflexi bacterium]|nr:hypothetical protein [Chloroflexota bacterium]
AAARDALERATEYGRRHPSHYPYTLHFVATAHAVLGDWAEARRLFTLSLEPRPGAYPLSIVTDGVYFHSRFLLTIGELEMAEAIVGPAYCQARDKGAVVHELNLIPVLAELALRAGRSNEAAARLERAREILARPQEWRGFEAAVQRAEGLLATTQRDWPRAERCFAQTLETERRYGFPYHEAQVLLDQAELCLERSESGDRERGLEKLDQALAIFQRCEAKRDVERVDALRARLGG